MLGATASPIRTSRGAGALLMQSSFGELTSALGTPGSMGAGAGGGGGGGAQATVRDVAMLNRVALLQQVHQRQVHQHVKHVYQHHYDEDVSDPDVAREVEALSQSISHHQQQQDFILGFAAEEEEEEGMGGGRLGDGDDDDDDENAAYYATHRILEPEVTSQDDVRRSPLLWASTLRPYTPHTPQPLLEPVSEEPSGLGGMDSRPTSLDKPIMDMDKGKEEQGKEGGVSGSGAVVEGEGSAAGAGTGAGAGGGEGRRKKRLSLELATQEAVQRRRDLEQQNQHHQNQHASQRDLAHKGGMDKQSST
jgi:hypothetical protein